MVWNLRGARQRLRNALLETTYRLPHHECLKPFVVELAEDVMRALEIENEDNAVVCLRIIIELHKNYRSSTASAPSSLEVQVRRPPPRGPAVGHVPGSSRE